MSPVILLSELLGLDFCFLALVSVAHMTIVTVSTLDTCRLSSTSTRAAFFITWYSNIFQAR
jgi:hypothetical protein